MIETAKQTENIIQRDKSGFWNKSMLQLLVAPSIINIGWALSLIAAPSEQWNLNYGISRAYKIMTLKNPTLTHYKIRLTTKSFVFKRFVNKARLGWFSSKIRYLLCSVPLNDAWACFLKSRTNLVLKPYPY